MDKLLYAILKNYKEINYLRNYLNDFSLKQFLISKGVNTSNINNEEEFMKNFDKAIEELENYPTKDANLMADIISKNFLAEDSQKLREVAKDLDLTYANAYRLRCKAIDTLTILMQQGVKV